MSGLNVASVRPEQLSRGGYRARGTRGANGYAVMQPAKGAWRLRWRWRKETTWRNGSVRTAEEARDWVERAREAFARGDNPPPMPRYDRRDDPRPPKNAPIPGREQIKAAVVRAMTTLERCDLCGLLRPCSPCIPELRREIRSARREM